LTILRVVDYMNRKLDIVIEPDPSWRWKDKDELDETVSMGLVTQAGDVRREGERLIGRLEARRPPFRDGWESWHPDPDWPVPTLPQVWDWLV